jgi:hypothetical protein
MGAPARAGGVLGGFAPSGYGRVFADEFDDSDVSRINENAIGGRPNAPAWRSRYRHDRFTVINQEKQIYVDAAFPGTADHPLRVQPFSIRDSVPGDRVPEVRFVLSHRLTPQVKTSFESSFATGGGGIFIGADGRPYKNQVRYMVTSLDTRFTATATGVFLAFHHLTQGQLPLGLSPSSTAGAPVDLDRLQLMLSQDLSFLWNLASDWALQVNMELSRGTAPSLASTDTQLHRRILGGIAVKF